MSISLINRLRTPFQLLRRNYSQPRTIVNMDECLITHSKDSEMFKVTFRFLSKELQLDKQINMERKLDETVNNFLGRINLRVQACIQKKQKSKKRAKLMKQPEPTPIPKDALTNRIKLLKNNEIVDENLPCETIIKDPDGLRLIVFDNEYEVKLNVPQVLKIKLPSTIMAGFPVYPSVFETQSTNKKQSQFTWYRSNNNQKWNEIGSGYFYTPTNSDIGYKLKIVCHPRNEMMEGPQTEVMSNGLVQAGPGSCGFQNRHLFTKEKLSGKSFRVVSYNILAETYSSTQYSQQVLFPYCPSHALEMDYRKQLILKEVIGYNADIICLQEVDGSVHENDLAPSLSMLNYDNVYNTKKDSREGLTIFFNEERFDKLGCDSKIIGSDVTLEGFEEVWSQVKNEKAKEKFLKRSTCVQAISLRSKENPSEILVVGNLHLYFHPTADHIRLLQAYYALAFIQKQAKAVKVDHPSCNVSLLLCGDFNSTPESGVYQFMTENHLPPDFPGWRSCEQEEITDVPLRHDLSLSSACGTPEYTNYTPGFSGCLDYIYYQTDRLGVEQVIPMPNKEEITAFGGLPSVTFPSDHIALCVDLKWTK